VYHEVASLADYIEPESGSSTATLIAERAKELDGDTALTRTSRATNLAWNEGASAFRSGLFLEDCPCEIGLEQHDRVRGWTAAEDLEFAVMRSRKIVALRKNRMKTPLQGRLLTTFHLQCINYSEAVRVDLRYRCSFTRDWQL